MDPEDQAEIRARRERRYRIDTAINWIFVIFVVLVGYRVIETDIDLYQGERLYFKMLNDGVSLEEAAESPYMQEGMRRNMHFKGQSGMTFFMAKWKWRVPIYLGCIFIPLGLAFFRVISKDRRRWNWAYYLFGTISIAYAVYFWGRWANMW